MNAVSHGDSLVKKAVAFLNVTLHLEVFVLDAEATQFFFEGWQVAFARESLDAEQGPMRVAASPSHRRPPFMDGQTGI